MGDVTDLTHLDPKESGSTGAQSGTAFTFARPAVSDCLVGQCTLASTAGDTSASARTTLSQTVAPGHLHEQATEVGQPTRGTNVRESHQLVSEVRLRRIAVAASVKGVPRVLANCTLSEDMQILCAIS